MSVLGGKKILIIGGSPGIGFRVAELAADEGADLIIVGRNEQRLQDASIDLKARNVNVEIYINL